MDCIAIFYRNIIIIVCIMLALQNFSKAQQSAKKKEYDRQLGYNGDLYDVFKKRLDKVCKELSNDEEELRKKIASTATGHEGLNTVAAVKVHEPRKETTKTKHSSTDSCLYEQFKRRLDTFNKEFALAPSKDLKRKSNRARLENENDRASMYDEYKKRLDKISSEILLNDGETNTGSFELNSADSRNDKKVDGASLLSHEMTNICGKDIAAGNAGPVNLNLLHNIGDHPTPLLSSSSITRIAKKNTHAGNNLKNIFRRAPLQQNKNYILDPSYTYGGDNLAYGIDVGSAYPTVLTKALESSLNPLVNVTPQNLLSSVASKMNISALDLAKKLTNINTPIQTEDLKNDPKLNQILQKYIETTVSGKPAKETHSSPVYRAYAEEDAPVGMQALDQCDNSASQSESSAHISYVLDKVLSKLERIQVDKEQPGEKDKADNCQPEGAPCDIAGSWNSYIMGLRFDISIGKGSERQLAPAEKNNKLLIIEATECVPPRHQEYISASWKFMGSALKQLGGPFYMYSQNRGENMLATFTGFCRTCGEIDTIFGSWGMFSPSKDCQDISTSFENKRDILRRYNMEAKRQQRYKDLLFDRSKFSRSKLSKKKNKK